MQPRTGLALEPSPETLLHEPLGPTAHDHRSIPSGGVSMKGAAKAVLATVARPLSYLLHQIREADPDGRDTIRARRQCPQASAPSHCRGSPPACMARDIWLSFKPRRLPKTPANPPPTVSKSTHRLTRTESSRNFYEGSRLLRVYLGLSSRSAVATAGRTIHTTLR